MEKLCGDVVVAVHVDDIVLHLFQYIHKLHTEGPQEWIFEEYKVRSETRSRHLHPEKETLSKSGARTSKRVSPSLISVVNVAADASASPVCSSVSLQDLKEVAFRFCDKERPRDYAYRVAGSLHVGLHHTPITELLSLWQKLRSALLRVWTQWVKPLVLLQLQSLNTDLTPKQDRNGCNWLTSWPFCLLCYSFFPDRLYPLCSVSAVLSHWRSSLRKVHHGSVQTRSDPDRAPKADPGQRQVSAASTLKRLSHFRGSGLFSHVDKYIYLIKNQMKWLLSVSVCDDFVTGLFLCKWFILCSQSHFHLNEIMQSTNWNVWSHDTGRCCWVMCVAHAQIRHASKTSSRSDPSERSWAQSFAGDPDVVWRVIRRLSWFPGWRWCPSPLKGRQTEPRSGTARSTRRRPSLMRSSRWTAFLFPAPLQVDGGGVWGETRADLNGTFSTRPSLATRMWREDAIWQHHPYAIGVCHWLMLGMLLNHTCTTHTHTTMVRAVFNWKTHLYRWCDCHL